MMPNTVNTLNLKRSSLQRLQLGGKNRPCTANNRVIICRSAGNTAPPFERSARRATTSSEEIQSRLQALSSLALEATQIAVSTGPRGIVRTARAVEAVLSVTREQLQRIQTSQRPDDLPVILRTLFERLGATYIKLGQFIASSPTIFPEEYVLEFQKCLDQTQPVPWEIIRKTIEKELKMPLEDVFVSVDPVPLASASIAQVHAAVLRGSNREVVIKVLKPEVKDVLTTDLNFLYLATRLLEVTNPSLSRASLSSIVSDIRDSMLQEVNFKKEAEHLQQFANYLDSTGLRVIATCPSVYKQFSTEK